jgi:hypothetical protein
MTESYRTSAHLGFQNGSLLWVSLLSLPDDRAVHMIFGVRVCVAAEMENNQKLLSSHVEMRALSQSTLGLKGQAWAREIHIVNPVAPGLPGSVLLRWKKSTCHWNC